MKGRVFLIIAFTLVTFVGSAAFVNPAAHAQAGERDEDAIFGGDDADGADADGAERGEPSGEPSDAAYDEDAIFGAEDGATDGVDGVDGEPFTAPQEPLQGLEIIDDALAIGGLLYLRLTGTYADTEAFGAHSLTMPNLMDLYLDARPHPQVRGFIRGRMNYDPTAGDPTFALDQLWIKTDIAHAVFLTIGQQPVKWGASRIWNPTDRINATQRDPLSFFDERAGIAAIKVHVPIESLGWNAYGFLLFGGATLVEDIGAALRMEAVFGPVELSLSSVFGAGRATSFGFDISAGIGPIDVTAEVAIIDAHGLRDYEYRGPANSGDDQDLLDFTQFSRRDYWTVRASGGFEWGIPVGDEDTIYLGGEYAFNGLGEPDPRVYAKMIADGKYDALNAGEHYAGLLLLYPSPGRFDEGSISFTTLGNLSDLTFVSQLNFSVRLHTYLTLETYARVHYGFGEGESGEFRPAADFPNGIRLIGAPGDPAAVSSDPFTLNAPRLSMGLNLRMAL